MAGLLVRDRRVGGVTLVSNQFIDRFLPEANGEFVKVYLFLIRLVSEGRELSVSYMADRLNNTEKDVLRAFKYWEKMKLLRLEFGAGQELLGLELLPEAGERAGAHAVSHGEDAREDIFGGAAASEAPKERRSYAAPAPGDFQGEPEPEAPDIREEESPGEEPVDLQALEEDEEFGQLLDVIGCYVGKILTARECEVLANLYGGVGMSSELLEYLVEYCVSGGHKSMRYIETVALNWHERGIETVEQARAETAGGGKNAYAVLKAFGLNGRNPAAAERSMIDRWFKDYSLPVELVLEACNKTMRTIHQPSFEYADKILKEWKDKGIRAVEDIARLDGKPEGKKFAKKEEKGAGGTQNFPQREYDCDELVRKLNGF